MKLMGYNYKQDVWSEKKNEKKKQKKKEKKS